MKQIILTMSALTLSALLLNTTANAADTEGNYITLGAGYVSCGTYASEQEAQTNRFISMISWSLGFMTAYNAFVFDGNDISEGTDTKGLEFWLLDYCKNSPTDSLAGATLAFIYEMKAK